MTQIEKQQRVAIPLLEAILTQKQSFSFEAFLQKAELPDSVSNHIGTILGAGQGGKGGMNLWKTSKGYRPCRENAVLVIKHVTDEMMQSFLQQHDWTQEEFAERVLSLPSVVT